MFKNYSVRTQSKLIRDENASAEERNPMEAVEVAAAYAEIVKDVVTHCTLTIGSVWAACKIVERICK